MDKDLELHRAYDRTMGDAAEKTVVLIHGIASDSGSFNDFLHYLENTDEAKGLRVVTFDLLGAGKSPKSDELDFGFDEQLTAMHNSILKLDVAGPLVVVGHSLGTFLVERYADRYVDSLERMVLVSAPVYTPEDFNNPMLKAGLKAFRETIAKQNKEVAESKAFKNEMKYIVEDPDNYQYLVGAKVPTAIIYGKFDKLIASFNLPGVLAQNNLITAAKTVGGHGITEDKFELILSAIKGEGANA